MEHNEKHGSHIVHSGERSGGHSGRFLLYHGFTPMTRGLYGIVSVILFIFICVQSLSATQVSLKFSYDDKIIHFAAYFVLTLVALPALSKVRPSRVWLLVLAMGMGVEVLQWAMRSGRQFDLLDGFANAMGAMAAILAWMAMTWVWKAVRAETA